MVKNLSKENLVLINFAKELAKTAIILNLHVRLFGSVGVFLHCESNDQNFTSGFQCNDIDIVARLDQLIEVDSFLKQKFELLKINGYYKGEQRIYSWDSGRMNNPIKVEVYFGQLYFNHLIPPPYFSGDNYLLPITQLLLSKLAIHELTEKDVYSIILILNNHDIALENHLEIINLNVILNCWSSGAKGWELSHSCLNSLNIVKSKLNFKPELYLVNHTSVLEKIEQLIISFQNRQKPLFWKFRNILGEKVKWYREVNHNDN